MYLVGAQHPNKVIAADVVQRLIGQTERLVTDAQVFQEILSRYSALNKVTFIEPAFDLVRKLADEIYPISVDAIELARRVRLAHPAISARIALHTAIMDIHQVSRIVSFDPGFDRIPRIVRIYK